MKLLPLISNSMRFEALDSDFGRGPVNMLWPIFKTCRLERVNSKFVGKFHAVGYKAKWGPEGMKDYKVS